MAFRTSSSSVVGRMAIGAGGAMMIEAVYPATCVWVIKGGIPIARIVTLGAGGAKLPGMGGWFRVTGSTVDGGAFENIIHMALDTSHCFMRASQREPEVIVRKINRVNESQRGIRTAVIRVAGPARTAYSALK